MGLWHLWVDVTHLPRASGIIHCNMRVCFGGVSERRAPAPQQRIYLYITLVCRVNWSSEGICKFWHLPSVCKVQKTEGLTVPALLKSSECPPQHVCDRKLKSSEAQGLRTLHWEQRDIHLINRCKAFKLDGAYAIFQMAQLITPCILTMKHDDAF